MKTKNNIFALTLALAFQSCEKVIEPKNLPEQDPRIVLNSILMAGDKVSTEISASKSIISGKPYKFINNATCVLYVNGNLTETLPFVKNGVYTGTTVVTAN